MKEILEKAHLIPRNMYVTLGVTAMPILIHAAYRMWQPDPSSYTVPIQGGVVSDETGKPAAGIRVRYGYDNYTAADTDSDGRFLLYVPD
jgi:hypothetical protein